ncbi:MULTISPECIES: hypothetical protein [unclassified Streptomyces]|uniref:hypothetical protein n=1 Tax=unclassified Streptomyces TaxID=2593676 RepID=UPI0023673DBD|nr:MULTISPECIES: hypothetical protein [unclassified Streptomyces]MDF3143361.1 hypothetical protein [Streptomyces sp. T21Q-yed]WDF39637.1 hypothetical protein PBV52_23940 [Streptomyces sp. T12]
MGDGRWSGDDEGWRVMGRRRTARWRRARVRRGHCSARARGAVVAALLLCTTAALPGRSALAAGTPSPYTFAPDARPIVGATGTADAAPLTPGTTYKSSLPSGVKVHYRLDLDATSDAYVSAMAIPAAGTTVSASDGIRVSVQDADGTNCSLDTEIFGVAHSPRPITAWAAREASSNRPRCEGAGTYYVIVERVGRADSAPETWDLELFAASEPSLRQADATSAPDGWNSASPEPVTGEDVRRDGGSGFASAASVGQGVWNSDITPGRTLFYRVPLDWGRQLYATAELGSSNGRDGYVSGALNLSLYNPVHGFVDDASTSYKGTQKAVELDPLPPVAYENRYAAHKRFKGMRFAGSYYLVVHLAADMAENYGDGPLQLTLRVRVGGAAEAGPGYAGESEPGGVFQVAEGDRWAAAGGGAGGGSGGGGGAAMTVLAVSGIGAGTLVLVVLGVWAVVARRRVGAW